MKVDICVVTKDSKTARYVLDRFRNADFVNNIIIETSKPLGLARMRAIQKASAEWVAFIDDDIIIPDVKKWFDAITSYITPNVGAVEGTTLGIGLGKKWDTALNNFTMSQIRGPVRVPKDKWSRGYTHNTLIRIDLIRDWKPSSEKLETYEDLELTKHVQAQGYDWLHVPVIVFHVKSWRGVVKNALWHGRTLQYCLLFTKREKVFTVVRWWTIDLFRDMLDPRVKWPLRVRIRVAFQMFFENLSYFLSSVITINRRAVMQISSTSR